jgi:hypothetical protein
MDTTEKTIMQGLPAKAAPSEPGFDRGLALGVPILLYQRLFSHVRDLSAEWFRMDSARIRLSNYAVRGRFLCRNTAIGETL